MSPLLDLARQHFAVRKPQPGCARQLHAVLLPFSAAFKHPCRTMLMRWAMQPCQCRGHVHPTFCDPCLPVPVCVHAHPYEPLPTRCRTHPHLCRRAQTTASYLPCVRAHRCLTSTQLTRFPLPDMHSGFARAPALRLCLAPERTLEQHSSLPPAHHERKWLRQRAALLAAAWPALHEACTTTPRCCVAAARSQHYSRWLCR